MLSASSSRGDGTKQNTISLTPSVCYEKKLFKGEWINKLFKFALNIFFVVVGGWYLYPGSRSLDFRVEEQEEQTKTCRKNCIEAMLIKKSIISQEHFFSFSALFCVLCALV